MPPAMQAANGTDKNFWLWGSWGKQRMKQPYLTQKLDGLIHDIVIGQQFIIALKDDLTLVSWGEDKHGCLGLGTDNTTSNDPKQLPFPREMDVKVVDIQRGRNHIMALSKDGKVWTWGDNALGQLGLGNLHPHYEPTYVEALKEMTVVQIVAVDNMSYALTSHGVVYAWGDNQDGGLGLEHDQSKVSKPEPMMRLKDTNVKRLMVKEVGGHHKGGKTVIGLVGMAEDLQPKDKPGGYDRSLKTPAPKQIEKAEKDAATGAKRKQEKEEKDIFESVNLMRKVMDNTYEWWSHLLHIRHGCPYEGEDEQDPDFADLPGQEEDRCTTLQLDTHVSLDNLEAAAQEVNFIIKSAKEQVREIRKRSGAKNVRFILAMFIDDCKLRHEKIMSVVSTRQLKAWKAEATARADDLTLGDARKIEERSSHLTRELQRLRKHDAGNIFNKSFQESLIETIECKLQVLEMQMDMLNAAAGRPPDVFTSSLSSIKMKWQELKQSSIYALYQRYTAEAKTSEYSSDEKLLNELVQRSDAHIDGIISNSNDELITHDPLIPRLCYDLLLNNAELRKLCNRYQHTVLKNRQQALPR